MMASIEFKEAPLLAIRSDIWHSNKSRGATTYTWRDIAWPFQHHDSIVTAADLGLALNCQYDLSNRTILNDFDLVNELI